MQRHVADVAGERRPDGSYEHQVVVWSVPRQTGKTTGIRAVGTHRGLVLGRDVWYTAQTGKDARARWMDLVKILQVHPMFQSRIKVVLRGGSEAVEFLTADRHPTGSFRVFAPTPESLHSYTPPTVFVDEAFAQSESAGELLMGAIEPAQQTLLDRQLWIVSTMGTAESTWFHDWIERARDGAPRVALFDWGATPDQDPYDLEDIAAFHPGVGFDFNGKALTAADILAAAERVGRSEYERAYANRRTLTRSTLIPAESVEALVATVPPPADPRAVALAYDVAYDRSAATIVAVWIDPATGQPHAKILQRRPGVAWLAPALRRYDQTWRSPLVATAHGPVTEVSDDLERRGVRPRIIPRADWPTASSAFLNGVESRTFTLAGEPEQRAAIAGLATSHAGDQLVLSRRLSIGDVSPAFALVAGLRHHAKRRTLLTPRIITAA